MLTSASATTAATRADRLSYLLPKLIEETITPKEYCVLVGEAENLTGGAEVDFAKLLRSKLGRDMGLIEAGWEATRPSNEHVG
jgi:hypothetical protein